MKKTLVLLCTLMCAPAFAVEYNLCDWMACNPEFIRGDVNRNMQVDMTDAILIADYLFDDGSDMCWVAADVDDDDQIIMTDVVYIMNYLNLGGPPPVQPFPNLGPTPCHCFNDYDKDICRNGTNESGRIIVGDVNMDAFVDTDDILIMAQILTYGIDSTEAQGLVCLTPLDTDGDYDFDQDDMDIVIDYIFEGFDLRFTRFTRICHEAW
jgi:hypothetical protein